MTRRTYRVAVLREADQFLGFTIGLNGAHSFGSSMTELDNHMREAIALVEDLPDGAERDMELQFLLISEYNFGGTE